MAALRWGRNTFFSIGLLMIFWGWLQFINFDGGWPSNQPPDKQFYSWRTSADEKRIWNAMGEMSTMTEQDWDDYHRCKKLNVCVRRFQGQRKELGGVAPTSNVSTPSNITQPNFESGTSSPTMETRCVLMDGVLKCNEYIRR
ncbi:MAG: hypothetical protein LCH95_00015 [Proteobacteria bacterium]|nr:hypothetical protein [Pseudomonadota bacterium]